MNERLENLMYHAGLTAQGCWDELDDYTKEGIEQFAQLIVKECAKRSGELGQPEIGIGLMKHFGLTNE